jgi:phage shock protein PspC (stress-responsive transcriptional regulator)
LIGAALFFVIVGVFGLFAAGAGLAVFVAISLLISRRSQETQQ